MGRRAEQAGGGVEPAYYRCCTCQFEWREVPGCGSPKRVRLPTCPNCGNLYFKWLNFEGWRQRNPIES